MAFHYDPPPAGWLRRAFLTRSYFLKGTCNPDEFVTAALIRNCGSVKLAWKQGADRTELINAATSVVTPPPATPRIFAGFSLGVRHRVSVFWIFSLSLCLLLEKLLAPRKRENFSFDAHNSGLSWLDYENYCSRSLLVKVNVFNFTGADEHKIYF